MRQDGKPRAQSGEGRPPGMERRRGGPRKQKAYVERAMARGHSGNGSESVRPHLRDQLKLKALLPQPFPTPEQQPQRHKDEHHR